MTEIPASWQPHLKSVVAEFGEGDATTPLRRVLELGLSKQLELEALERAKEGRTHDHPWISDAGKCPRATYLALSGVPKTEALSLDSWMTLTMGRLAETLYIQLLEMAGVKIVSQQRVELERDGHTISGRIDLLVEIPDDLREQIPGLDERELWEIKTKNSRAMGWTIKRGGPAKDDNYVRQVNGYLHAAAEGKIPKPTYARARLVYTAVGATKGEPLLHAWFVEYDRDQAERDIASLASLAQMAKSGVDPGIPEAYAEEHRKTGKPPLFPCGYCDYRGHCFTRKEKT